VRRLFFFISRTKTQQGSHRSCFPLGLKLESCHRLCPCFSTPPARRAAQIIAEAVSYPSNVPYLAKGILRTRNAPSHRVVQVFALFPYLNVLEVSTASS
jgi:hypothetical protein